MLENRGLVRQFVPVPGTRRKGAGEDPRYFLDARDDAMLEIAFCESALHAAADLAPLRGLDLRMDAAVDDDLGRALGGHGVDQQTAVLLGTPAAQQREDTECPAAKGLILEE